MIAAYAEHKAYAAKDRPNVRNEFNRAEYNRQLREAKRIAKVGEDIEIKE